MATSTPIQLDSFQPPPLPVRRFTVDEYHRMREAGVLTEDDRVELLEGWIVPKMIRTPRHDNSIELVEDAVRRLLPDGWRIRTQCAVRTADSEPEPDLAVVGGSVRARMERHPKADEVALVIEVSESSLSQDRTVKARLYARAGIPTYWIINLVDAQVEVLSDPTGADSAPSYRQRTVVRAGESVPLAIGGSTVGTIAVSDLLP